MHWLSHGIAQTLLIDATGQNMAKELGDIFIKRLHNAS